MTRPLVFTVSVGDEVTLTVDEVWSDGGAPENPTVDDVIEELKRSSSSAYRFARDWGFEQYVEVNGKPVSW